MTWKITGAFREGKITRWKVADNGEGKYNLQSRQLKNRG
jgi:hypothetical protein